MTRDHFSKYMASPKFQQDVKDKEDHKKVCEKCRLGIVRFYLKKITKGTGK
jgi:hypothetical protein